MGEFDAQLTRLMADPDFSAAMKKICDLARDGKEADKSRETLCAYAFLIVRHTRRRGRSPKENWERRWAQGTGKTWKALTEFPSRIRKTSAEVKGVSSSCYFDPKRAIRGQVAPWADFSRLLFSDNDDDLVDFAKQQFSLLPVILDRYADWLEVQTKGISALMRYFYRRTPRKHSLAIHEVSKEVKRITGRVCDRQVADLLNAADCVVNPKHQGNGDRFDEQTIALLRSRQKRKSSKT